jgi:hypothetical protein
MLFLHLSIRKQHGMLPAAVDLIQNIVRKTGFQRMRSLLREVNRFVDEFPRLRVGPAASLLGSLR